MVGGAEFQSQTPVQILTRMVYLVFMNQIKATFPSSFTTGRAPRWKFYPQPFTSCLKFVLLNTF